MSGLWIAFTVRYITSQTQTNNLLYAIDFSKPYGQYIIDSVCEQCNSAYLELNNFKGDVHFIGFSLGGIIAYDVATMQWLQEDGCPPWKESDVECQKPDIHVPPLNFKIRSLFTCGSPIGNIIS